MEAFFWVALWIDGIGFGQAPPALCGKKQLERVNGRLHGQLVDFTHNHGCDRRVWSPALKEKRDLYVYLPPGYDPAKQYPLGIFLHGAGQDELFFLQAMVEPFDRAIADGKLPPLILAAPDGSMKGRASMHHPATFWANSRAGCFEDYVMNDVWQFLHDQFSILPEREAHGLLGVSMGGSATFALAIKHRDRVKMGLAFMPVLNLRYVDCHGRYRGPFDPNCFGFRERMRGWEKLGSRGLATLRFNHLFVPMFGHGPAAIEGMSRINPLELMENCDLRPGELDLYVGYGCQDEFKVAAQVESFLHFARQRGVAVETFVDPQGRHNLSSGLRLLPDAIRWASERVPLPR